MKFTVTKTPEGPQYFRDGKPVTWRDIAREMNLPRNQARLVLKKAAASGEEIDDLAEWRDRQVVIWKLENVLKITA